MRMKSFVLCLAAMLAISPLSRAADVTVKITKVHLCCDKCVNAAKKVVSAVDGASATPDKTTSTVEITAPDTATVQKAVDALVKAGFFGECGDPSVKISAGTSAKGDKVQTLTVKGVHLCCPSCVKAVHKALAAVPGDTADTAAKGVESFTVTGDFKDSDIFAALQKAGLTGSGGQ